MSFYLSLMTRTAQTPATQDGREESGVRAVGLDLQRQARGARVRDGVRARARGGPGPGPGPGW